MQINRKKIQAVFFSGLLFLVVFFGGKEHAYAMTPVYQVLQNTSSGTGAAVASVWKNIITMINYFIAVLLLLVAFAQILRINVNTYGVKKILPTLIMSIIAANFSFLFCRLMVDFANVVIDFFINGPGSSRGSSNMLGVFGQLTKDLTMPSGGPCHDSVTSNCYSYATLFWYSVANLMVFAGGIIVLILAYLFIIRNYVIYFMVPLAPLAFMAMVLPQTKQYFNQWWNMFSKWTFMPVPSVFMLWLGTLWFKIFSGMGNTNNGGQLLNFFFAGLCFYLAITIPFKMGGAIMGQWGNFGKNIWNKTGGAAIKGVYGRQKDKLLNRLTTEPVKPKNYDQLSRFQKAKYQVNKAVSKPGQFIDNQMSKQKYYSQQEKDIRAKALSNAEKRTYASALEDHYTGKKPLNSVALSRATAKMRVWKGEEMASFSKALPADILGSLKNMGAINEQGKLISEAEILSKGTDAPAIKAAIEKLLQLRQNTKLGPDASAIWDSIVPEAYDPAKVAQQDVAGNIFNEKTIKEANSSASSAVRNKALEDAMVEHSNVYGANPEDFGNGVVGNALRVILAGVEPNAQAAMAEVYGTTYKGAIERGAADIEATGKGLNRIRDINLDAHGGIELLGNNAAKQLEMLDKGGLTGESRKEALRDMVSQFNIQEAGLEIKAGREGEELVRNALREIQLGAQALNQNPAIIAQSQGNWNSLTEKIAEAQKAALEKNAHIEAGSAAVSTMMAQKYSGIGINQAGGHLDEMMQDINANLEKMSHVLSERSAESGINQLAAGIKPGDFMDRAAVASLINQGGSGGQANLGEIFGSKAFREGMAAAMRSGIETAKVKPQSRGGL